MAEWEASSIARLALDLALLFDRVGEQVLHTILHTSTSSSRVPASVAK